MKVIEQLKGMRDERFLAIYEALSKDGFGPLDGEVARALKFRPQAIRKLPFERRAKKARSILEATSNAELCYEVFGSYLMATRKQLVIDFLDATGVPHEDGMIANVESASPAADKIGAAVAELDKNYDQDDVTLYLALCAQQWPGVAEVETLWRMRG
jgi:hypothetical protein